jgi:hypothetical protein
MPQGEDQADSRQNKTRPTGPELRAARAKGKLNSRNRYLPLSSIAALYTPARALVSP